MNVGSSYWQNGSSDMIVMNFQGRHVPAHNGSWPKDSPGGSRPKNNPPNWDHSRQDAGGSAAAVQSDPMDLSLTGRTAPVQSSPVDLSWPRRGGSRRGESRTASVIVENQIRQAGSDGANDINIGQLTLEDRGNGAAASASAPYDPNSGGRLAATRSGGRRGSAEENPFGKQPAVGAGGSLWPRNESSSSGGGLRPLTIEVPATATLVPEIIASPQSPVNQNDMETEQQQQDACGSLWKPSSRERVTLEDLRSGRRKLHYNAGIVGFKDERDDRPPASGATWGGSNPPASAASGCQQQQQQRFDRFGRVVHQPAPTAAGGWTPPGAATPPASNPQMPPSRFVSTGSGSDSRLRFALTSGGPNRKQKKVALKQSRSSCQLPFRYRAR